MKFLYKINSNYDGFRPNVLPERIQNGKLRLGWRHYLDVVEKGWECWVYFHGPHRFENGVYVKGTVDLIDHDGSAVYLRVRDHRTDAPLTSKRLSAKVAEAVATRYRQVFLWPEEWLISDECSLQACKDRNCDVCASWRRQPLIKDGASVVPRRLRNSDYEAVVPAHWIVPRRCYESAISPAVRELTRRFMDFKLGEMAYSYPFALAMYEQLRQRDLTEFDYIVPIPLSPDKAALREKHRTLILAKELSRLLSVPVREMLTLSTGISKRRLLAEGYTAPQFENLYRDALQAKVPMRAERILLVDDVMTRGSTISQALHVLKKDRQNIKITVATVGQMIVKEAVMNSRGFKNV